MSWRDRARPIIAKVIAEIGLTDMKRLRKAISEAYPFGPREMHPYKIWCDEVRRQLGLKVVKDRKGVPVEVKPLAGQQELFNEKE